MARRSYGTGSLLVRRGAWYGQWHAAGRQVMRKLGPIRQPGSRDGLTKAQAERELRRRMEQEQAVAAAPARLTVAEAGERLVEHLAALGRKKSTVEGYRSALNIHLGPFFKDKPIERITRDDVERFIAYERREGRTVVTGVKGGKVTRRTGSSSKSIQNYLGVLHGIFELAIRRGWAMANPVKHAERPVVQSSTEIRFVSMDELEALLRAVPDEALGQVERVMYLAAATTGMRQGELVALRWRDVDWSARRIRVRRNYVRGEYGSPKSKRSSRAVPLIDRLAGDLDRLAKSTRWSCDDDLVFAHPATAGPLDRSKILKRFKAAMRAAGLSHRLGEGGITFHSLRHSFGTAMAAQGVPMRGIQELMGHRDFATTLIYADYSPSAHEAEWAEAAFASTNPSTKLSETEANSATLKPLD